MPTDNELFQQISKAMQDDDSVKLSSIFAQESPEEQEQPQEDIPAEEPEVETPEVDEDEPSEEDGNEQEQVEEEKDPLTELKEQIAELKKQQQALSSQTGRVPSLQRKLAEYDRQLAELKNATSGKTSEKIKPELDELLKDLDDTDPVLANTMRQALGKALNEIDTGSNAREIARIESLRESDYAEYVEGEKAKLLSKYPNVGEVFKSEGWQAWKKEQPKHILELAGSDSADAVIMAMDLYRKDMIARYPELANRQEEKPVVDERAQQIEESRKKQQRSAANLDSGKPPAQSKGPLDAEALFKQFSDDIRKDIRGG